MLKDIKLIVYDFDGVMTDNRVVVHEDGMESVIVNRADGLGVNIIKEIGIPQMILSTETSSVVEARAKKLGIPMIQGVGDKKKVLAAYCKENKINPNNILYVGNDINDKEVMGIIGYPVAPSDAHLDIKKLAKHTLETKGGYGVVKELAEILKGRMRNGTAKQQ